MNTPADPPGETYSPWTVVHLVLSHLAEQGLHPVLGAGDPGEPAASLLRALGIAPSATGDARILAQRDAELAALRTRMLADP